jgi:hypothetical protein
MPMRRAPFIIACCAVTIGGCSRTKPKRVESARGEVAAEKPRAAKRLAPLDVTGRWNVSAIPQWKDPLITHFVLDAGADTASWTISYPPNPTPLKARHVTFSGDSVVLDWGPYLSARRSGAKATSHDVYRLRDGKLEGTSVSHYAGTPPGTVRRLRLLGTRAPRDASK